MTDTTTGYPPFINRRLSTAEFLAYVAAYDFGKIHPSRVVLHHTFVPTVAQWNGLATMRGMQTYYRGLGWKAAPHLFVAPDGIWLATPMKDIGIHAGTGNSGRVNGKLWYSIGLEMVGFYDKEQPSGAIWEQSKTVMGSLSRRLSIHPRQLISFHRDYTNLKSCPGWAVTKEWVWSEVEDWLEQAGKVYRVKNGVIAIVRKEADSGSARVRSIGPTKPVTVIGEERDGRPAGGSKLWYQVEDGYIHSSALVKA